MEAALEAWHRARGARLEGGRVVDYGDPQAEARALVEGAGLWERGEWGLRRFVGEGRVQFLHNYLTQEVRLEAGRAAYACALTVKGALVTDLWVLLREQDALAIVPPAGAERLSEHLRKYALLARVTIEPAEGERALLTLSGARAAAVLAAALGEGPLPESGTHVARAWGDGELVVARLDPLGGPGYDLLAPRAGLVALLDALAAAGAQPAGQAAADARRVEAGIPLFGVDMDEGTLPPEAGLEARAVSFTKGCYIGQEVIARVTHRGRVNRHLRRLELEGDEPLALPAPVFVGEKEVGAITTCARAADGRWVGLGIVHRKAEPGARVHVGAPAAERTAAVAAL